MRLISFSLLAVVVTVTACGDGGTVADTAPTTTLGVTIVSDRPVADLLESFGDPRLEGIEVATTRMRMIDAFEQQLIAVARRSEVGQMVGVDLDPLDDATIRHLAYLYCAFLDNGAAPEQAMAEVTASLVAIDGRDAATPDDQWRGLIVSVAGASVTCSTHFKATNEYLETLVGG